MKRILFYSLIFLMCAAAADAGLAAKYKIVDLGTLGGTQACAYCINNNGQVVGQAQDAMGRMQAVLYKTDGTANIDLGTLPDGVGDSGAYCINDLGQIVGFDYDSYWSERAVIFDASGAAANIALGSLGGGMSSVQWINGKGQIVGWASTPMDQYYFSDLHAVLFDASGAGKNKDLDDVNSMLSMANCINNNGLITGVVQTPDYTMQAVIFNASGASVNIGAKLSGDFSSILACNDGGLMVGYGNTTPGGYDEAMIFDANGKSTGLGGLGGTRSYAESLNAAGEIAGSCVVADGSFHATWFDASGAGANVDLNTLIDPNFGVLNNAYINDKGQICGSYTTASGDSRAYLLTPVEEPKIVEIKIRIEPETLNLQSNGCNVMVFIRLPKGLKAGDVDKKSIMLGTVTAKKVWLCGHHHAIAEFDRSAVEKIVQPGDNELKLTGKLADGTNFWGTDTVRAIAPPKPVKDCKKK